MRQQLVIGVADSYGFGLCLPRGIDGDWLSQTRWEAVVASFFLIDACRFRFASKLFRSYVIGPNMCSNLIRIHKAGLSTQIPRILCRAKGTAQYPWYRYRLRFIDAAKLGFAVFAIWRIQGVRRKESRMLLLRCKEILLSSWPSTIVELAIIVSHLSFRVGVVQGIMGLVHVQHLSRHMRCDGRQTGLLLVRRSIPRNMASWEALNDAKCKGIRWQCLTALQAWTLRHWGKASWRQHRKPTKVHRFLLLERHLRVRRWISPGSILLTCLQSLAFRESHLLRNANVTPDVERLFQAIVAQEGPAFTLLFDVLIEVLDADGQQFAFEWWAFHCFSMIEQVNSIFFTNELSCTNSTALEVKLLLIMPYFLCLKLLATRWMSICTTKIELKMIKILFIFLIEPNGRILFKYAVIDDIDIFAWFSFLVDCVTSSISTFLKEVYQLVKSSPSPMLKDWTILKELNHPVFLLPLDLTQAPLIALLIHHCQEARS